MSKTSRTRKKGTRSTPATEAADVPISLELTETEEPPLVEPTESGEPTESQEPPLVEPTETGTAAEEHDTLDETDQPSKQPPREFLSVITSTSDEEEEEEPTTVEKVTLPAVTVETGDPTARFLDLMARMMAQQSERDRRRDEIERKQRQREKRFRAEQRRLEEERRAEIEKRDALQRAEQECRENRLREEHKQREEKLRDEQAKREKQLREEQEEKEQSRREEEERKARELREQKEAKEKERERIRQLPPMQIMPRDADILEFLSMFESQMTIRKIPKDAWTAHLYPLLNQTAKASVTPTAPTLDTEYPVLKDALIQADIKSTKNAALTFWTLEKQSGQTLRSFAQELTRLIGRFAGDSDGAAVREKVVTEKFLQAMPQDVQQSIRLRGSTGKLETIQMAEEFFATTGQDAIRYNSNSTHSHSQNKDQKDQKRHHRHGHRWNQQPKTETTQEEQPPKEEKKMHKGRDGKMYDLSKIQCHQCKKMGHLRRDCPTVSSNHFIIQDPQRSGPITTRACWIGDKYAEDVLLDSGANISMVSEDILPDPLFIDGRVWVERVDTDPKLYCTTTMNIKIAGMNILVTMAILPRKTLRWSAIIGTNLRGINIRDLLPDLDDLKTTGSKGDSVNEEQATEEEASSEEMTDSEEKASVSKKSRAKRQRKKKWTTSTEDNQMVNVLTRAATQKQKNQEEEEDRRTEQDAAQVVGFDELPDLYQTKEMDEPVTMTWNQLLQEANVVEAKLEEHSVGDQDKEEDDTPRSAKEFQKAQEEDSTLADLFQRARDKDDNTYHLKNGLLMRDGKDEVGEKIRLLVVPTVLRRRVFREAHSAKLAGHYSHKKTRQKIARAFYWPGMSRDTKTWTAACPQCQRGNTRKVVKAPLQPLPEMTRPFDRVAVDLVGPLPRTKRRMKYILTLIDYSTRFPEAIPLPAVDAETVATALVTIFSRFGIPRQLLCDNGKAFVGKLTACLMKSLGVHQLRASAYHPQTNGAIERWHGVLKAILRKGDKPEKEWDLLLPYALFASRDTPHGSTNFTPFQLLFGREVRGPISVLREKWTLPTKAPAGMLTFLQDHQERLEKAGELARQRERKAKQEMKTHYDKTTKNDPLEPGTEVMMLHPAGPGGLAAAWVGPFEILERIQDVTYRIAVPGRGKKGLLIHRNHQGLSLTRPQSTWSPSLTAEERQMINRPLSTC